ncbi:MAG: DUF2807 domain-containing protein [Prevotellaceae bacterium]|jgi:hypothetical protein|nr:DUF2807 domain-containing protein [Prevotellaceae bacterium]
MKKFLYTIICVVLLTSCSDEIDLAGRGGTFEFLKDGFSGVSVQDGFELYLISGDTSKIKIESDESVINHVKYEIKNGILYFYKELGVQFPGSIQVKIHVTKKTLDALVILSSKVQIVDTLRADEIHLVCSDKSSLTGRLECEQLQAIISNSTVELTGVANIVETNIDNGSSVKTFGLATNNTKVNIAGGSYGEVTVNNEFNVTAKEKSILHYKGTAIIRNLLADDDSVIKEIK